MRWLLWYKLIGNLRVEHTNMAFPWSAPLFYPSSIVSDEINAMANTSRIPSYGSHLLFCAYYSSIWYSICPGFCAIRIEVFDFLEFFRSANLRPPPSYTMERASHPSPIRSWYKYHDSPQTTFIVALSDVPVKPNIGRIRAGNHEDDFAKKIFFTPFDQWLTSDPLFGLAVDVAIPK